MSYEEDVRFVAAFARGGNWELGLRIARNVGRGEKGSLANFANDTGLSVDSVRRPLLLSNAIVRFGACVSN